MGIVIRKYQQEDLKEMTRIWNQIVREGVAFPQKEEMSLGEAKEFFASQSYCGVALDEENVVVGLYILHPNNVGRCGHIANASFGVEKSLQGKHVGRELVHDCLQQGCELGFRILQFNAVVTSNEAARHLYEELGFNLLGTIPQGFFMDDGRYEDICVYYKVLGKKVYTCKVTVKK